MSDPSKHTPTQLAAGIWGGPHVRLDVREGGAEIEYDCAHGTLAAPLVPDAAGRFEVGGTHVREGPGPIRLNVPRVARPARYAGTVTGDRMTLTVTLTDRGEDFGSFTLTRGSEGRLRKCR